MNKKIVLIIALIIISLGVVAFYFGYQYLDNPTTEEEITGEVIELTAPVDDYETVKIESIVNAEISAEEKYAELLKSASLKITVERYDEALKYQEAALGLNVGDQQSNDILLYELILLSRKLNDADRVSKYETILGAEKLLVFDTPRNKIDEAP